MFQCSLTGKNGSGSGFGSWKTVPAVPVPLSVSGKTVPTVPGSGSGSVPEPPCLLLKHYYSRQGRRKVSLKPQSGLETKALVLKHYYRRQGRRKI